MATTFVAYDRETLTISTTSLGFTSTKSQPSGGSDPARQVIVSIRIGGPINWTLDTTAPTATTGQGPKYAGESWTVDGATDIANFRTILDTIATEDATLECEYLR
tara:strand:+ start:3428 stop:3742 length:315 start_codon:yes stop_codon:yes gene_type:complete